MTNSWPKSDHVIILVLGLIFILGGTQWIFRGYDAFLAHRIIPGGHKHAWMTGEQAMLAGSCGVLLGISMTVLFFRSRRNNKKKTENA